MKKLVSVVALLLAVLLTATACKAPEEDATAPSPTPTATPTQAIVAWTPEPTVTPRPMDNVEQPAEGQRAPLIDPINTPTLTPLTFNFVEKSNQSMGLKYEVPGSWIETAVPDNSRAMVYTEPASEMHMGVPASVTIAVSEFSSQQSLKDAEAEIDNQLTLLRAQYPDGFENSRKAQRNALDGEGSYVTYWLDITPEGAEDPVRMRGRCMVIAKGKYLYMIRSLHPANWNTEYDEKVFKQLRSSLELL